MSKRILFTGGSGFIGSHIVEKLIERDYFVTVVDLWQCKELKKHSPDRLQFLKIDANDLPEAKYANLLKSHDHLFYFSSILGTSETITKYDPAHVLKTNTETPLRLMKFFCENDKKLIIPITPIVDWLNPYKITKNATESFAKLYNNHWNKNIICIRLGNVYGPRERWLEANKYENFKHSDFNYKKIIPSFIVDVFNSRPVTIYGDGKQRSDYIFVADIVNIFIKALESKTDLTDKIIETGGSDTNYSVLEIVETLERLWGKKIDKKFEPMRPGEKEGTSIKLNQDTLYEKLDYQLKFSLEEGLIKTIEYYEGIVKK